MGSPQFNNKVENPGDQSSRTGNFEGDQKVVTHDSDINSGQVTENTSNENWVVDMLAVEVDDAFSVGDLRVQFTLDEGDGTAIQSIGGDPTNYPFALQPSWKLEPGQRVGYTVGRSDSTDRTLYLYTSYRTEV